MKEIKTNWQNFKTLTSPKNLLVQYLDKGTFYDIFAVDGPILFQTSIKKESPASSDQTDFENNYKDVVTNKPIATLIRGGTDEDLPPIKITFPPQDPPTVIVQGTGDGGGVTFEGKLVTKHILEEWDNDNINVGSGSWDEVYTLTGPATFFGCMFQLNTDDMYFRAVRYDGSSEENCIDVDLEELKDDYKFKAGGGGDDSDSDNGGGSGRFLSSIGIGEYDNKKWKYQPPAPIRIKEGEELRIKMKSHSGTKKIYRALTSYGRLEND